MFDRDRASLEWALYTTLIPILTRQWLVTHALPWDGLASISTLILWCFWRLYRSISSDFRCEDSFEEDRSLCLRSLKLRFLHESLMALTAWGKWPSLEFWTYFMFGVFSRHMPHESFDGLGCFLRFEAFILVLHQHLFSTSTYFLKGLIFWLSMFSILVPLQPILFSIRIQPCSLRLLGPSLQSLVILLIGAFNLCRPHALAFQYIFVGSCLV